MIDAEGEGTELVSVYIPPETMIATMLDRLQGEMADAENIQSKQTRKRVQGAIDSVMRTLSRYKRTPENGLVVFAGYTGEEIETFVYDDLPRPIESKRYVCDDTFYTEDLEELYLPDTEYGLVTISRDRASIGSYRGRVIHLTDVNSHVMGKSKAGGQSAARFERVREKQKENHYKRVANVVTEHFDRETEVVLGGTNVAVSEFRERIPNPILGTFSVEYAGHEKSLDTLADQASDLIEEEESREAREAMERFLEGLANGNVTYGAESVVRAIELGAVQTLILGEKIDSEQRERLSEKAEQMGGTVHVLDQSSEVGEQLHSVFGGTAAILRFDV